MHSLEECSLFGGAVFIKMPGNFIDASALRQVPDNQEVFLQKDGPTSLIVEILEPPQATKEREEGCLYYLRDLVGEQGTFRVFSQSKPGDDRELVHVQADQAVDIKMYLCRLSNVNADILITMNRQPPDDPIKFRDIAASLQVRDWSLFSE